MSAATCGSCNQRIPDIASLIRATLALPTYALKANIQTYTKSTGQTCRQDSQRECLSHRRSPRNKSQGSQHINDKWNENREKQLRAPQQHFDTSRGCYGQDKNDRQESETPNIAIAGNERKFHRIVRLSVHPTHHRSSISSHPNALTVTRSSVSTSTVVVSASMMAGPVRECPGCSASSA